MAARNKAAGIVLTVPGRRPGPIGSGEPARSSRRVEGEARDDAEPLQEHERVVVDRETRSDEPAQVVDGAVPELLVRGCEPPALQPGQVVGGQHAPDRTGRLSVVAVMLVTANPGPRPEG